MWNIYVAVKKIAFKYISHLPLQWKNSLPKICISKYTLPLPIVLLNQIVISCANFPNKNPSAIPCTYPQMNHNTHNLPFKNVFHLIFFTNEKKHLLMPKTSIKLMWMKNKPTARSPQSHALHMFLNVSANSPCNAPPLPKPTYLNYS